MANDYDLKHKHIERQLRPQEFTYILSFNLTDIPNYQFWYVRDMRIEVSKGVISPYDSQIQRYNNYQIEGIEKW